GPQPQQPYSGWQYSQEQQSPRPPVGPPPGYPPPNPNSPYNTPSGNLGNPAYSPISQFSAEPYYPDLTMDIGSSLGYGQSMEYHSISMPQPTQTTPRLRQSRLQQLREERMRRQQRRINLDATILRRRKEEVGVPEKKVGIPPGTPSGSLGRPATIPGTPPASPLAIPPSSPLPGTPAQPGGVPLTPPGRVNSPALVASAVQPAAEAAQDTGMIQRVKVARAAFLITGAFMFSSMLGLVRTFLFTYVFGATNFSDSYLQAFLIPNLIFTVVSGGALSSAFIPVFTTYAVGRKDEKTAWHIASSALNLSVIIMVT